MCLVLLSAVRMLIQGVKFFRNSKYEAMPEDRKPNTKILFAVIIIMSLVFIYLIVNSLIDT